MKWRNAWRGWIFYLTIAPIMAGFLMGIAGAIAKDPSGRMYWKSNFDSKTGLTGFVAFAILALLLFAASLGVRYLFRKFRRPN